MRAVRRHDVGDPEVLSIAQPDPLAHLPCWIGPEASGVSEASGVIGAVGDGVTEWRAGDRVSTTSHHTATNAVRSDHLHANQMTGMQLQLRPHAGLMAMVLLLGVSAGR
ncbi:MAG: hypothetical protein GY708_17645 [Actinomycetia bacterium]|nr:hypothetical protein [Actinomycetes bacterium]